MHISLVMFLAHQFRSEFEYMKMIVMHCHLHLFHLIRLCGFLLQKILFRVEDSDARGSTPGQDVDNLNLQLYELTSINDTQMRHARRGSASRLRRLHAC